MNERIAMFFAQTVYGAVAIGGLIFAAIDVHSMPGFALALLAAWCVIVSQYFGMLKDQTLHGITTDRIAFGLWAASFACGLISFVAIATKGF